MSSLPYKSFTILGAAGSIGRYIFDALRERNASIVAVTCSSSSSTDALPNDVKVAKVDDYKNVEAVAAVPRANRIEVVICALTWQSVEVIYAEETVLANAARGGGCQAVRAPRVCDWDWAPDGKVVHEYHFLSARKKWV